MKKMAEVKADDVWYVFSDEPDDPLSFSEAIAEKKRFSDLIGIMGKTTKMVLVHQDL